MGHTKLRNYLDNTQNYLSKFRTRYWFEVNDDWCRTFNKNSQKKFTASKLNLSLCDYSDPSINVKKFITAPNIAVAAPAANNTGKKNKYQKTMLHLLIA